MTHTWHRWPPSVTLGNVSASMQRGYSPKGGNEPEALALNSQPKENLQSHSIAMRTRVRLHLHTGHRQKPPPPWPLQAGGGKAQRKERRRPGTRTLGGPCPAKWKEKERPDARPLKPPPRRLLNSHRLRGGNLEVQWLESWRPP